MASKTAKKSHTVKIYTTPTCIWCKRTKEFFKENNITYEEIDVANDRDAAEEMIDKSGQTGTPVIDVDGKIIVGFDEEALTKALDL